LNSVCVTGKLVCKSRCPVIEDMVKLPARSMKHSTTNPEARTRPRPIFPTRTTSGSTRIARNADRTMVMQSALAKKQNVRTIVPKIRPNNVAICFSHRCSGSPPSFRSVGESKNSLLYGLKADPIRAGMTRIARIKLSPPLG
jgi:hypothetical protein